MVKSVSDAGRLWGHLRRRRPGNIGRRFDWCVMASTCCWVLLRSEWWRPVRVIRRCVEIWKAAPHPYLLSACTCICVLPLGRLLDLVCSCDWTTGTCDRCRILVVGHLMVPKLQNRIQSKKEFAGLWGSAVRLLRGRSGAQPHEPPFTWQLRVWRHGLSDAQRHLLWSFIVATASGHWQLGFV